MIPFPTKTTAGKRKPARLTAAKREQLIVDQMPLARSIAGAIWRRLPPHIRLDDLISEAYLGLTQAAQNYDPSTNVPFDAFVRRRIAGAVIDSVRRRNFKHTSTLQLTDFPDLVKSCQVDSISPLESEIDEQRKSEWIREAIDRVQNPVHRRLLELRYETPCSDCPNPEGCTGCPRAGMTSRAAGATIGLGESRSSFLNRQAVVSLRSTLRSTAHFGELEKAA